MAEQKRVIWFDRLRMSDIEQVGGKNASLGEMIAQLGAEGVRVPGGFATTASAFREFLAATGLTAIIDAGGWQHDTITEDMDLSFRAQIRGWIDAATLPAALKCEIEGAYQRLNADNPGVSVAVRSSATAEDMPDASFAGQQETFLNISGLDNLIHAIREVFASLYTDRAIAYRTHQGYGETEVALSVGVQRMVRSDKGAAGVMFTLDTESGFDQVVFITASYGLGGPSRRSVGILTSFTSTGRTPRGALAIRARAWGKGHQMVFADKAGPGESVTPSTCRGRAPRAYHRRRSRARADALVIERHYGKAMDIEGATASTASSTSWWRVRKPKSQ
jgi:pyruvate,water dikinase